MKEINLLEGKVVAPEGMKVGIVASRFNEIIVNKLLGGAVDGLVRHGVEEQNITAAWVPGAFEIPVIAKKMAEVVNETKDITPAELTDRAYETIHKYLSCGVQERGMIDRLVDDLTQLLELFFFALRLLCARQERQEQQGGNPEKFYSFVSHKPANL